LYGLNDIWTGSIFRATYVMPSARVCVGWRPGEAGRAEVTDFTRRREDLIREGQFSPEPSGRAGGDVSRQRPSGATAAVRQAGQAARQVLVPVELGIGRARCASFWQGELSRRGILEAAEFHHFDWHIIITKHLRPTTKARRHKGRKKRFVTALQLCDPCGQGPVAAVCQEGILTQLECYSSTMERSLVDNRR
jgi:hypothetical protein